MTGSTSPALAMRLMQRLKEGIKTTRCLHLGRLLVVVAIVGILSAVALQTSCLKPIKQKQQKQTNLSATLKQARQVLEDGNDPESDIADMTTFYGTPEDGVTLSTTKKLI